MYKKITHHIVEEHFDHPAVLPPGMITDGSHSMPHLTPMPSKAMEQGVVGSLPKVVINENTLTFRMDSRTLWNRYALGIINYSVSYFGDMAGTSTVEKNLSRNSSQVGDFFTPYYGISAGTKISNLLLAIYKNGEDLITAIKTKQTDFSVYQTVWQKQINELSAYLNELNPSQYPVDLLTEMFVNLTTFWTNDFIARFNNDFSASSTALDNILKIAVTGVPDHEHNGYSSIADLLSRGIIIQFPLSFVD